ncbi:MAG: YdcH family protein [Hydrogenophilaceae bacterium]|nr:YdcH family protein [Hydrogenophilaceae bacterium]
MELEPHDLAHEFPEHKETMRTLKQGNAHFAKLFDEYHAIDREVRRIEQNIEPTSDVYAEELKKKRLALKDELYQMLVAAKA